MRISRRFARLEHIGVFCVGGPGQNKGAKCELEVYDWKRFHYKSSYWFGAMEMGL
ncbi:MAG: hypothetical protein AAGB46_00775 [Verrucomicrobiota bacterium]